VTIVVDVANVMGSRPDGWWRDRAGAAVRLHAQIARLAASGRAILPPPGDRPPGDDPGPSGDDPGPPEVDAPAFVLVLEGAARAAVSRLPSTRPATDDAAGGTGGTSGTGGTGGTSGTGGTGGTSETDGTGGTSETSATGADSATGPPQPGEVRVVEARGSGDDAIVAVVRELPGRRVVVTADRELRARCVAAGAEILGPGWLLGLL
jgi:8-oxo-dGTP diphosphatase